MLLLYLVHGIAQLVCLSGSSLPTLPPLSLTHTPRHAICTSLVIRRRLRACACLRACSVHRSWSAALGLVIQLLLPTPFPWSSVCEPSEPTSATRLPRALVCPRLASCSPRFQGQTTKTLEGGNKCHSSPLYLSPGRPRGLSSETWTPTPDPLPRPHSSSPPPFSPLPDGHRQPRVPRSIPLPLRHHPRRRRLHQSCGRQPALDLPTSRTRGLPPPFSIHHIRRLLLYCLRHQLPFHAGKAAAAVPRATTITGITLLPSSPDASHSKTNQPDKRIPGAQAS